MHETSEETGSAAGDRFTAVSPLAFPSKLTGCI